MEDTVCTRCQKQEQIVEKERLRALGMMAGGIAPRFSKKRNRMPRRHGRTAETRWLGREHGIESGDAPNPRPHLWPTPTGAFARPWWSSLREFYRPAEGQRNTDAGGWEHVVKG